MTDVYKRLAKKLDELPNGYPETENGVELRILQKVFTPEEAENTLKLRPAAETVEEIANRLGTPVHEMQAILDDLVMKGQIGTFKRGGKQMYKMYPFAVGIYEEQFLRKDKDEKWLKEFCELFEEYLPFFGEY